MENGVLRPQEKSHMKFLNLNIMLFCHKITSCYNTVLFLVSFLGPLKGNGGKQRVMGCIAGN